MTFFSKRPAHRIRVYLFIFLHDGEQVRQLAESAEQAGGGIQETMLLRNVMIW